MHPDTTTLVSPLGFGVTALMGLLILLVRRKHAFAPIMMLTCYLPMGQTLMVGPLHFTMLRLLMLFGWARVILRRELRPIKWNQVDLAVLAWVSVKFVTYLLLWQTGDALVYALGLSYNAVGFYFLFRMLLHDVTDIVRVYRIAAMCIVPLALMMVLEKMSGHNSFAVFGGISPISAIRDGVVRCSGPFAHPILAGTFGATLLPFFVALWRSSRGRLLAVAGIASSVAITLTSGSSGPLLSAIAAIAALCTWPIRMHMRFIRRGVALLLVGLHMVMKAPVWFLLARVDIFSGSTGYHRAFLIDRAVANLNDWWLVGTKDTNAWGQEEGLFDITNQYLVEGANGGIITMFLFICVIVSCFRCVGLSVRRAAKTESAARQFALWALGAALFAHVVTYISVSYFDQNFVNWYLLLGMISTATQQFVHAEGRSRVPLEARLRSAFQAGTATWEEQG
jgi:hypothetical protein